MITLNDIIDIADAAYPDGLVRLYHDDPHGQHGDTLAKFIAIELRETYYDAATDKRKLDDAYDAIEKAVRELQRVLSAFMDAEPLSD